MDITKLSNRITTLEQELTSLRGRGLPFPIPRLDRRNINRDLPVIKRIDGDVYTVEINDREYSWDFGAGGGGGGGASTATLIVGPASNADSADYDYTTDGTDDDVQIQAAIDALSGGGMILLREGTYTLGAEVNIDEANTIIAGVGDATVITIKTNFYNGASIDWMFNLSVSNCVIRDLKINGNKANQTDYGGVFNVTDLDNTFFNVNFTNSRSECIYLSYFTKILDCRFSDWEDGYFAIDRSGTDASFIVRNCAFSTTETGAGCIGAGDYQTIIEGCSFYLDSNYNTIAINTCNGIISNNDFIINGSAGSFCKCIVGNTGSRVKSNNFIFGSSSNVASVAIRLATISEGNYIDGAGVGISGCEYIGANNIIINTIGDAILVGSGQDHIAVRGNLILDCGQGTNDTYSGIHLDGNNDHCVISDNIINSTATNKLKHGIVEDTGCDSNIIANNSVTGSVTAQITIVGGSTVSDNNITA